MKELDNNHIALRNLSFKDIHDMFAYSNNTEVAYNAGWQAHKSIDETKEVLKSLIESNEVWGIYHIENDKLIGSIGLHFGQYPLTESKVHALGFVLNPDYWGKGIMKEAVDLVLSYAFDEMNITEVYANHFSYNKRSESFMNKYGMTFVGTWYNKKSNRENKLYKITNKHEI